jgi:small-conductance mechanosensitive channel
MSKSNILKYLLIFVLLPLLVLSQKLHAQVARGASDSALAEMQQLLQESEQLRWKDSVRAAILYEELNQNSSVSQSKQRELQAELELMRNRDSLRMQQQKQAISAMKLKSKGAAVLLFYDTVFIVNAPLGSFSADQRAEDAAGRIRRLYEQQPFIPDSLHIKSQYGILNLVYGTETITSISNVDALWLDTEPDSLAVRYRTAIIEKVHYFQKEHSAEQVLLQIGYVVLVLVVWAAALWLLNGLFRKLRAWIRHKSEVLSQGIKVKSYQLFTPARLFGLLNRVLLVLRVLLFLLLSYLALTYMFSIFPGTRNWANTLLSWIWQPLKTIGLSVFQYIPSLITIIVIVIVTRLVARIFRFLSLEIERGVLQIRGFHQEWARPTYNIVRFLLFAFAFVIIFPYLPGSHSDAFKGVSVFLGILFSIGSSSAISNTIAGLVITYMRPFQPGDWIRVNDVTGCVMEKTILVTRLRTIHNQDVTVPNSTILASHTVNYSSAAREEGLILSAEVTIGYDTAWQRVHGLLLQAAAATADVCSDPQPFVFQKSLDEFYVVYELNIYTKHPGRMFHIQSELFAHIQDLFREAGIDMMSSKQVKIKS